LSNLGNLGNPSENLGNPNKNIGNPNKRDGNPSKKYGNPSKKVFEFKKTFFVDYIEQKKIQFYIVLVHG
jgi:hypothetical protein